MSLVAVLPLPGGQRAVTPVGPNGRVDIRLLVSLSGVGNTTLLRLTDVIAELAHRGVPVSLLVRPQVCARSPLVSEWVRARTRQGDAVLLHGYNHAVTTSQRPMPLARKAEFATLPAHEASLRLTAAVATLERIGLPIDGFAPPRWLASAGTLTALHRLGFALCADAVGVHDLRTGELHRARVQMLTTQSHRTEVLRCFALVLGAARAARRGGLVRIGADADDLARPGPRQALLDAVDVAIEAGATPSTYGNFAMGGRLEANGH